MTITHVEDAEEKVVSSQVLRAEDSSEMKRGLAYTFIVFFLTALFGLSAAAQDPDSVVAADSLLLELQREIGAITPPPSRPSDTRSRPTTNPDISVIGDVRALYFSEGNRNFDLELHEVETAFKSVIDPFARADVYIAAHNEDGEIEFELEEAFLTTLALPNQLQLKAGKFRSNIGKINRIHPHALPFPDIPVVYTNFFGDEGLNDQGIGLSWLLPNSSFYQDISIEITRGPDHNESFQKAENNRYLYASHLKNFWDLSDDTTFELGVSGLAGPNHGGLTTLMGGVDLTYKWKPVRFNTYQSFTAQMEAFLSRMETEGGDISTWGMYALASYQLSRRWLITARFDHSDIPDDPDWNENGFSATLAWYVTEFQKIEFGLRRIWSENVESMYTGVVRAIFVIGTHGAHEY